MEQQTVLKTQRLLLRPFSPDDADDVTRLANDRDIAANTRNIPYPYMKPVAERWIADLSERYRNGTEVTFAITHTQEHYLIGAISLMLKPVDERAELGYWIGRPYWNNGYATEAARVVVQFGFEELRLNRIYAQHLKRNPASGRILQKIGMKYEGCLRQHIKKWGAFEDIMYYGILKSEFEATD